MRTSIPFLKQNDSPRKAGDPTKTIVAGYDGTEAADRALERVGDLASHLDAKVVVTSVTPLMIGGPRSAGPIDPTDTLADHRRQLRRARAALEQRGVKAETVPATGDPSKMIVEVADREHADLVVVGARRLHRVRRAVGQSVSRRVARRAHCDVLVVH